MSGHDRLERAFAPLVEHLAFKFQLGGPREELPLSKLAPYLATSLREIVAAEKLGREPVLVLDLHGMTARDAKQALVWDHALTVVYFGKGEGVLEDVFHEIVDDDEDLVLIGTGGATDARPGDAMGVVLSAELAERLSILLDGEDEDDDFDDEEDLDDEDLDDEDLDDEDEEPPSEAPPKKRAPKKAPEAKPPKKDPKPKKDTPAKSKRGAATTAETPAWRRAWPVLLVLGAVVAVLYPPILVAYVLAAWLWYSYRD